MKKLALLACCAVALAACSSQPTSSPTASASPTSAVTKKTIILSEQNASGQQGTATIEEVNSEKVDVTLLMTGANMTQPQPAHIHVGACPNPGAVKYPLKNVVNGSSVTTLPVGMQALLSQGELAINVHKSEAEVKVYTACGDVK